MSDHGKGLDPLDPRSERIATRTVDPLRFCPECKSDDKVESDPADTVTFTETNETVRAAICLRCRIMWTERSPSGKELRADHGGGAKARAISLPGSPVRPYSDPRLDPRLVTVGKAEHPAIRSRRVELRRDIAYYEACKAPGHTSCRCHEIERKWSKLWDA